MYRRTEKELPARLEEIRHAKEEGIIFKFLHAPVEILEKDGYVAGMKFEKIDCGNGIAVAVSSDSMIITDVDSALDLLMSAKYEAGTKYIVVDKKNIIEDFFILSSGLAGEILQKFINYGGKIAIYGDFSHYTSKPLKDFIFESNKGKDVFFVATKEEAIQKISQSI